MPSDILPVPVVPVFFTTTNPCSVFSFLLEGFPLPLSFFAFRFHGSRLLLFALLFVLLLLDVGVAMSFWALV